MSEQRSLGPFKLVTVNTAPERAKILIGRVIENVKDKYEIVHSANIKTIDNVAAVVEETKPDILFTASMWTPEESRKIQGIAKDIVPGLTTFALPQGLQVERGPGAVVEYIEEHLPSLIEAAGAPIR